MEITTKPYNFALAFEKHRDVAQSVSNYFCNFAPPKAENSTTQEHRDVAQSGLEYSSGGRVVASSNLVIPTERKGFDN